jgi:cold-inducible RNA-binding protein
MSKKLYIGNLSFNMTDDELKSAFSEFGEVVSASVVKDRVSGRSRGFGFVEYTNEESAQKAREAMNGKSYNGRALRVDEARDQDRGPGRGDGGQGRRFSRE